MNLSRGLLRTCVLVFGFYMESLGAYIVQIKPALPTAPKDQEEVPDTQICLTRRDAYPYHGIQVLWFQGLEDHWRKVVFLAIVRYRP